MTLHFMLLRMIQFESLEHATIELFQRFSSNLMEANPSKYHFITSRGEDIVNVENNSIRNSKCKKLLDIKIHDQLLIPILTKYVRKLIIK